MATLVGIAFLALAGAALIWGLQVYLGIRAHRNRMDDIEGRWK